MAGCGHSRALRLLLGLLGAAVAEDAAKPLPLLQATRSPRRLLVGGEVREYVELDLRFGAPLYARVCEQPDALYVTAAGKCATCPKGCVLSSFFGRTPWVPGLLPPQAGQPDCLCGLSYEEIQLRASAWPGDPGFQDVKRTFPTFSSLSTELRAYATALWQYDALMVRVDCPGSGPWPDLGRFGLNSLPLDESLWWLRRFETAFGLEGMDSLITNASRDFDDRRAVFLVPVRTVNGGRVQHIGPGPEDLANCSLEFPNLAGPGGEPVAPVPRVADLQEVVRPCLSGPVATARAQMRAVFAQVPDAARQQRRCNEDWRTSLAGVQGARPAPSAPAAAAAAAADGRLRRLGSLALMHDFGTTEPAPEEPMITCSELRWKLRMRAHNMRERALSYTATDAANGCWHLMERLVTYEARPTTVATTECTHAPQTSEYWASPCCNPQLLREQCCAIRNVTVDRHVAVEADTRLLARQCRLDSTGGATYARAALTAALAWHRRLTENSGVQGCWKALMAQEQAAANMWQTLERCHADVMGRYDRELRMYVGAPCLVDEDCLTHCIKPTLRSLQIHVAVGGDTDKPRQLLGRCRVPTRSRHVYLLRCFMRRSNPEVLELLALELDLHRSRRTEADAAEALGNLAAARVQACIGPYAAPGVLYTREQCEAPKVCNWNHEVRTREECERFIHQNNEFCGCLEGFCFQQSLKQGCLPGDKVNAYCHQARELLRATEIRCAASATTPAAMARCGDLANAHSRMLRACLERRCIPPQFAFVDERCINIMRQRFTTCHEVCQIPSGPMPLATRKVCYMKLRPDETALDCFKVPGDTQVHYEEKTEGEGLSLQLPEDKRPEYCSVRVWRQLEPMKPARSRFIEEAVLATREAHESQQAALEQRKGEGAARQRELMRANLPSVLSGCDMGVLPVNMDSQRACRERQEFGCCLMPLDFNRAMCEACDVAHTMVCRVGDAVEARWSPNMRPYLARVAADLGNDLALVDWADGSSDYREVPWVWIRNLENRSCTPEAEGCASHDQCRSGEYCYGCELCAMAHGGNPPPHLCAPCPTIRAGACGKLDKCRQLQDAVDGTCPPIEEQSCPCKEEWSVRLQYEGAPDEISIQGCFYDKAQGFRWCEVDHSVAHLCEANRIFGSDRFIFWRHCTPDSCEHCKCDCSPNCTAYNVVPVGGRPPAVAAGPLGQVLPPELLAPAGRIAPNCSDGSFARIRGLCDLCVSCCATFCHNQAEEAKRNATVNSTGNATGNSTGNASGNSTGNASANVTNATGAEAEVFDCTASDTTGCSDSPQGWMDSQGRSCRDYALDDLCTPGGQYGTNWNYNPPREFKDFTMNGRSAEQACCSCGGGGDCSDTPADWRDADGYSCVDYGSEGWCNRTGYGPGWQPAWGPFGLGTGGVDAISACCPCGGGRPLSAPAPKLLIVNDLGTCAQVWPGRAQFQQPPWVTQSTDLCRLLSGICMRKLTALVYDPGLDRSVPDDPRIYGLCEQRAFETGRPDFLEDRLRRLAPLEPGTRWITQLQSEVQELGSSMSLDLFGNSALGMCYYRLPDPFGISGGPRRESMSPPLPPPAAGSLDLFSPPGIERLGWPSDFWRALPESQEALQRPPATLEQELMAASSALRATLLGAGVELVLPKVFDQRLREWEDALASVGCAGASAQVGQAAELKKYRPDMRWETAEFADEQSCMRARCDLDERLVDKQTCQELQGCTASCAYCASPASATAEQGICYTTQPDDVARCGDLGGVLLDGQLFNELQGVSSVTRLCAMPHRPLAFCTAPGERVRRCAHFDVERCGSDPVAQLLGCAVGIRRCQTSLECSSAGTCSDTDVGLSWATQGTCVITPLDDTLVRSCDEAGLCYLRLDPPFGMEVRWKHGLLDLLGPPGGGAGTANSSDMPPMMSAEEADRERLRTAGLLNRTECEALQPGKGRKAIWLQRARSQPECGRWRGCCLARSGERCELFSGPIVDPVANSSEAAARQEECLRCTGEWVPVFRWEEATWRGGTMVEQLRKWYARQWGSANEWVDVVELGALRQLLENAAGRQLGRRRLGAAQCLAEPLFAALGAVAAACPADAAAEVGAGPASWPLVPSSWAPIGSVMAVAGFAGRAELGAVDLSWHEYSASEEGLPGGPSVTYELALEPLERELAVAATQVALPGRAEYTRSRLLLYAYTLEKSTTPPPRYETNQVTGQDGGYPTWLINQMSALENPELERERLAVLIADEEMRRKQREEMELARAVAADLASGLPAASQAMLAGEPPPASPDLAEGALEVDSPFCRNTVSNGAGEVVGQLLGDCIWLNASQPLVNAVELCLPVAHGPALNDSVLANNTGIVLDFARKEPVPEVYNTSVPPPLPGSLDPMPGKLGGPLWDWESGPLFGRLLPGGAVHVPLGLRAQLREGRSGMQLCAKVFHTGLTYCPIVRLDDAQAPLPRLMLEGGGEAPPLNSSCLQLDAVLSHVQEVQIQDNRTSVTYVPLDMQASDAALLQQLRAEPPRPALAPMAAVPRCLAGQCLALRGREFQVVSGGTADCALRC